MLDFLNPVRRTLFASESSSVAASSAFSPDGKWLAYHSNEPKRLEVFVQPFPPNGTKLQISKDSQSHTPLWSKDGKQLFYIPGPNQLLKTSVAPELIGSRQR